MATNNNNTTATITGENKLGNVVSITVEVRISGKLVRHNGKFWRIDGGKMVTGGMCGARQIVLLKGIEVSR